MKAAVVAVSLFSATGAVPGSAQARPAAVPVVRLPFPQDDGSLTPFTFELGYPLLTLVYDTLMWRDRDGVPQPWLARSVEPSLDGNRVEVRLTEEARWHDGAPLTAEDVAFTFDFFAKRPHPRFTPQLRAVSHVEVLDAARAVITLRQPSPGFTDQPLSELPILPKHLWAGLPQGVTSPVGPPVGSGPYRLVDYRPGEAYRFEANDAYFLGRPAVSTIEVPIVADVEQTLRALERREVDMIPVSLPRGAAGRLEGPGVRLLEGTSYVGTVLVFNLRRPPFDRVEVRRAVAQALDLRRILRAVGDGVAADRGYLHPESPWSSAEMLHSTDEAASRAALEGLHLPPVEVLTPDNDQLRQEAGRQVALALQRVGVVAEAKAVPRQELSLALGDDGSTPQFDLALGVAPPLASYDPDFLRRLFGSDGAGTLNVGGYRSATFDALAERIGTTRDADERRAVVRDALRLLASDVPVVPLYFLTGAYAYRPAIYDGWGFVKGAGIFDKRSFVEPTPPQTMPSSAPEPDPRPNPEKRFPVGPLALAAVVAAGVVGVVLVRRR